MSGKELKDMPGRLVDAVRAFDALSKDERREAKGLLLKMEIETAGRTADFLGGFDGMKELEAAAENRVGNDNSIGGKLNYLWDGIGGWWA